MGSDLVIREALPSDAEGIAHVARVTWNDVYADIILPENRARLLARWYAPDALRESIGRENLRLFVALAEDKLVGFAQFAVRRDRSGQLTRIYVLPDWQRKAIGSALFQEGLAVLAGRGVVELFVEVEKDNHAGKAFYGRKGFRYVREFFMELPDQTIVLEELVLDITDPQNASLG